jgi:chitin deacetylase
LALLGFGAFFAAWPTSSAYGKVFWRYHTHDKVIALTFDDGPNEPYTSEVLKILKDNGIHATFFLIGNNVKYYPNTAREIVREGHVIGNHTYSHPLFLAIEQSKQRDRQIDLAERTIEEVTGVHCTLFRPPHGFRTPWLLNTLNKREMVCVEWAEDGNDWNKVTSEQIAKKVLINAKPGNIILLHDGMELKHGYNQSETIKALPEIIEELKDQGYRFVTIPELLGIPTSPLPDSLRIANF